MDVCVELEACGCNILWLGLIDIGEGLHGPVGVATAHKAGAEVPNDRDGAQRHVNNGGDMDDCRQPPIVFSLGSGKKLSQKMAELPENGDFLFGRLTLYPYFCRPNSAEMTEFIPPRRDVHCKQFKTKQDHEQL